MPRRGKLLHVRADLRQNVLRGLLGDARNRAELLNRLNKRGRQHLRDALAQSFNQFYRFAFWSVGAVVHLVRRGTNTVAAIPGRSRLTNRLWPVCHYGRAQYEI